MSVPDLLSSDADVRSIFGAGAPAARTILWGALIAGSLDITAALVSWAIKGVPPIRILQSIAAGLLGRDAFSGGAWSAALGLLLHFLIMSVIAAIYYIASRRSQLLITQWAACGVMYGVCVYFFMSFVVLPLSALPGGGGGFQSLSALAQELLVQIVCVGLSIAFITRRLSATHFTGE